MNQILTALARAEMNKKIVLLVFDGLGGLSMGNGTELEAAHTPMMDRLAREGVCGLATPVAPGITPGSGAGHLALFGYDPIQYQIGRGVLSALGVGLDILPGDVATRVNFCALSDDGFVLDRRACRPTDPVGRAMIEAVAGVRVQGAEVFCRHEKEHRAAVVFRGQGLSGQLTDSDPQKEGSLALPIKARDATNPKAVATAKLVQTFCDQANAALERAGKEHPQIREHLAVVQKTLREQRRGEVARLGLLLRGFDEYQPLPQMGELFKITPCAIATYPAYRGVAKLVGMNVVDAGTTFETEIQALEAAWKTHDFFYIHIKYTDSRGEDGNFQGKVLVMEEVDPLIRRILALGPTCLCITGDHSTPAKMKAHSFHPLPVLIHSPLARTDEVQVFTERECVKGGLGHFLLKDLMALLLAHADRLEKFGA